MVKFSFLALATALTTASANTAAAPTLNKKINLGNRNLRRGDPTTEALIKKAMALPKGARRLEEDAQFEITGDYSIQFSECVDITTYDEDLFDEDMNLASYVQSGELVASKSYVVFHVCTDSTCYLDAEDDKFIVDLPTYLTNMAQHHANVKTDYCEQCNEFEEYCNPEEEEVEEEEEEEAAEEGEEEEGEEGEEEEGEEGQEEEEGEEGEEEGEDRRKLKKTKKLTKKARKQITRKLADKEAIDCNQCQSYGCYVDEEEQDDAYKSQQELDNEISEWIEQLGQCVETGAQDQKTGLALYAGAMCTSSGDGVELAIFANEECTWYTKSNSFQKIAQYSNGNADDEDGNGMSMYLYSTYAENYIKSAFSEVVSCAKKAYYNPYADEEEDENEDDEQEGEVSQYCQGLMEEEAVSMSNCAADEEEEEEEEEEDENAANYSWFTYDMKEADDINQVCVTVNSMESAYYSHVYDEETSGSWYTRNKKGQIVTGDESEGLSGGAIAAIVLVALGVVGAAGFFLMKKKGKTAETDYQGGTMS